MLHLPELCSGKHPRQEPDKYHAHLVLLAFVSDNSSEWSVFNAWKHLFRVFVQFYSFLWQEGKSGSIYFTKVRGRILIFLYACQCGSGKIVNVQILTLCHRLLATYSVRNHFSMNINKMFGIKLSWSSLIGINFLLLRPLKTSIIPARYTEHGAGIKRFDLMRINVI